MLVSLFNAVSRTIAALPLERALALGRWCGWVAGNVVRHRRAAVLESLATCFPERSSADRAAIANRMYRNLGMVVVECLRLPARGAEDVAATVEWERFEILRDAAVPGRGALALCAHLDNWEFMGVAGALRSLPFCAVVKDIKNQATDAYWKGMRERLGVHQLPVRHSYRACLKALKEGNVVALVLDQRMRRQKGIFVDFFGRPASTSPGLAFLAAQTQVPVVPVFMTRVGNEKHLCRVFDPLPPPPDRHPDTIRAATQLYTRIIEDRVREHPDQWIWLHKRWKHQPLEEGEAK
jgi:Kdo2-lipid IVA lauroyltransferase/acyltransferase